MSHTDAFFAFNQACSTADRLHWGQVLMAQAWAEGDMPLTLKIYLQELRDTRCEWEIDYGQDLYALNEQDWAHAHSWNVHENKLFRRWAAEGKAKGRQERERTITIKRRARRAAKYA
jgi:hypothetical protein